jgi:hypothetical protein
MNLHSAAVAGGINSNEKISDINEVTLKPQTIRKNFNVTYFIT